MKLEAGRWTGLPAGTGSNSSYADQPHFVTSKVQKSQTAVLFGMLLSSNEVVTNFMVLSTNFELKGWGQQYY